MARKVRHAPHDILEAIERVETITHDKTLAQIRDARNLAGRRLRALQHPSVRGLVDRRHALSRTGPGET
jgi:hypothetical protein